MGETSLTKEGAEAKRKDAEAREKFKEEARRRKDDTHGARAAADDGGMELGYVNDLNRFTFVFPISLNRLVPGTKNSR